MVSLIAVPTVAFLGGIIVPMAKESLHTPRPEYVPYDYMYIRTKVSGLQFDRAIASNLNWYVTFMLACPLLNIILIVWDCVKLFKIFIHVTFLLSAEVSLGRRKSLLLPQSCEKRGAAGRLRGPGSARRSICRVKLRANRGSKFRTNCRGRHTNKRWNGSRGNRRMMCTWSLEFGKKNCYL